MAQYHLKLPPMGESIAEAIITKWTKAVGDTIQNNEVLVEVSTDKVDNEIPVEVTGIIKEICAEIDQEVQVGQTLAIIETDDPIPDSPEHNQTPIKEQKTPPSIQLKSQNRNNQTSPTTNQLYRYAPVVKTMAKEQGLTMQELEAIEGTGVGGRVMKADLLNYLKHKRIIQTQVTSRGNIPVDSKQLLENLRKSGVAYEMSHMGRTRRIIASRMKESLSTSAHVHSIIDVDVTDLVNWRAQNKEPFQEKTGQRLTFTPIFFRAVADALKKFPMLNASIVAEDKIALKKEINLGMATALPNGDLIVPVIKYADKLNLTEMAIAVNDLALRAKTFTLNPEDTVNATYTVTNIGMFDNLIGAPIINQPQVGILAIGAIRKMPAVLEGAQGDYVAIRHMLFLTQSFDHRIVDGAIGGLFLKEIKTYLEDWNNQTESTIY